MAAKHALSGSAAEPGPRCRKALRSTRLGSAPSRPCTPTSGRCKCRAEMLLPEVLQLHKVLVAMLVPWVLQRPGLLVMLRWQCRRVMRTAAKAPRLHPAV